MATNLLELSTKVVALDVYGTILCSDDPENAMSPRKGLREFYEKYESLVKFVSVSDSDLINLKIDLNESLKKIGLSTKIFDRYYRLQTTPKDFEPVIADLGILPEEFFIIGDSTEKDIAGARICRCSYFQVPEYTGTVDDFDFSKLVLH